MYRELEFSRVVQVNILFCAANTLKALSFSQIQS